MSQADATMGVTTDDLLAAVQKAIDDASFGYRPLATDPKDHG